MLFRFLEAGKIQVYVRVRPFTEKEKEKRETNAIEIHQEHSLVSFGPLRHTISVCSVVQW